MILKDKQKTILIAGGAGYIGSHITKMLALLDYYPVIFDNLSTGTRQAASHYGTFIEGDLTNVHQLDTLFGQFHFDAVFHFAASIDVGESVTSPLKYYANNVANTVNLLDAMRRHGVNSLIFSSSAAIFGHPQSPFICENHPCIPINPYGESKLMVEKILRDADKAYGIKSCSLRYFNAAGGDPDRKIKNTKLKESNLIPLILKKLKFNQADPLTIFGTDYPTPDGTCVRDYIHIEDLGSAHILAMKYLTDTRQSAHYNLGNGRGFSINEVIETAQRVTGHKLNIIHGERRPGDPPYLIADAKKAMNELYWQPKHSSLETLIETAWNAL